ncbi:MAG: D-Ala-D-Ala carboxypeptidase family metallohydrolase [Bacillota bacterium]
MGGAANSYHLKDMAADIRVLGLAAEEAASLAEQAGFDGIGFTSSRVLSMWTCWAGGPSGRGKIKIISNQLSRQWVGFLLPTN